MKIFNLLLCCTLILCSTTSSAQDFDGFALYNNQNSNTAYLIDKNGDIAHTWNCPSACNYSVLLMDTGNIMRGAINNGNQINGPAVGGKVQELDPNANVVWEFVYSSSEYVAHHDITLMPQGGVLLTAWNTKSAAEMTQAGFEDNDEKYSTQLLEVRQNGTGGEIIWEWDIFDHLVQDYDASKDNYGSVADNPQLLNINVETSASGGGPGGPGGGGGDWIHTNGVNYNADLDQIVFSSRYLSELFIIDHSTSTAEAAGHTGGNAGKGGDFLYRWGNPGNYNTSGSQVFPAAVHDARWIPAGPRAGYIQVFNNEGGSGGSSTVDAIETPLSADGYNYDKTSGNAYAPFNAPTWRHECLDNADGQSSAISMPNGNLYVNVSGEYMYEVDSNDNLVWQYGGETRKGFRYTCDHPGIQALIAQGVISGATCPPVAVEDVVLDDVQVFPNPSNGIFHITGLDADHIEDITVTDVTGKVITQISVTDQQVDLSAQPAGMYFIAVRMTNKQLLTRKLSLMK